MARIDLKPIDTARLDTQAVQRQVDLSLDYKKLAERYLPGLPAEQARITGEYLADLVAGNDSASSTGSFLHDLVFGREKK